MVEALLEFVRSRVAPSDTSRAASASTRSRLASSGVSRPSLARTSMCRRFLIDFFSGTTWNQMRGPSPRGSTMRSVPMPSSSSGTPIDR